MLDWDWLEAVNPQIDWPSKRWTYPHSLPEIIIMESPGRFLRNAIREGNQLYLMAQVKIPEPSELPSELQDLADFFYEGKENDLVHARKRMQYMSSRVMSRPTCPCTGYPGRELAALREYSTPLYKKGGYVHPQARQAHQSSSLRRKTGPSGSVWTIVG